MSLSSHKVYLIISKKRGFYKTYVGYTKNIRDRLSQHNSNKGAKSTKGRHWKLVYTGLPERNHPLPALLPVVTFWGMTQFSMLPLFVV